MTGGWKVKVDRRSGGRCEAKVAHVCSGEATDYHHIELRSQGGWKTTSNMLHICSRCHTWIHRHLREARDMGLVHPNTPLDLNPDSMPGNLYAVYNKSGKRVGTTSRNKARKLRRHRGYRIERIPANAEDQREVG